jgi:hypothetical protein
MEHGVMVAVAAKPLKNHPENLTAGGCEFPAVQQNLRARRRRNSSKRFKYLAGGQILNFSHEVQPPHDRGL